MLVKNRIITAEALRTQRKHFFVWPRDMAKQKAVLAGQPAFLGPLAVGNYLGLAPEQFDLSWTAIQNLIV
jgi:hypothetical protein